MIHHDDLSCQRESESFRVHLDAGVQHKNGQMKLIEDDPRVIVELLNLSLAWQNTLLEKLHELDKDQFIQMLSDCEASSIRTNRVMSLLLEYHRSFYE